MGHSNFRLAAAIPAALSLALLFIPSSVLGGTSPALRVAYIKYLANASIELSDFDIPNKEQIDIDVSDLLDSDDISLYETVTANFFPDDPEVSFQRLKAASASWYGETEDYVGMVNFNVVNGRLTGSAIFNDTVYHIVTRPLLSSDARSDGIFRVQASRGALADFPQGDQPLCLNNECHDDSDEVDAPASTSADASETNGARDTIDSMIVYTYRAMCSEAALPFPCEITPENKAPIEDRARLAVEEANSAYELSGIKGTQVLVHVAMVDETYDESTKSFQTLLDDLSLTDDGLLDEVHEWRTTYGADLVSMFQDNGESCGLAWLYNESPEAGFSVVYRDCATGYFSYAHETGHNMGAHHEEANSQGTSGIFSFGFQDPQERFRTILAYDCPSRTCLRIQRFSSPNITLKGEALGDETADNARKIDFRWDEVAAFVEKGSQPPPAQSDGPTVAPTSASSSIFSTNSRMILVLTTTFALSFLCFSKSA